MRTSSNISYSKKRTKKKRKAPPPAPLVPGRPVAPIDPPADSGTDVTSSSAGDAAPSRAGVDDGASTGIDTSVPLPGGVPLPPVPERGAPVVLVSKHYTPEAMADFQFTEDWAASDNVAFDETQAEVTKLTKLVSLMDEKIDADGIRRTRERIKSMEKKLASAKPRREKWKTGYDARMAAQAQQQLAAKKAEQKRKRVAITKIREIKDCTL